MYSDRLHWDGNTIPTSHTFSPKTGPEGSNFRNRISILNSLFCPNLNCVEPLCSVHGVQYYLPVHARISPITSYAQSSQTRCPRGRSFCCLTFLARWQVLVKINALWTTRRKRFVCCLVVYSALILHLYRARLAYGMKLILICSESSLKYHPTRHLVILQSYVSNLVMK